MELSINERLSLSNQYLILQALYPDRQEDYERMQMIVERGYEGSYFELVDQIYETTTDDATCQEVLDILEMFTRLEWGYASLTDAEKDTINEDLISFYGWDGNNEGKHLSYAKFFCFGRDRFEHLGARAYANSHCPTLIKYRAMLQAYDVLPFDNRLRMGLSDIQSVIDAWETEKQHRNDAYARAE